MRKKRSNYQTLHNLLNTSSETFMLVALISLFALPFVIASNLEPAVKQAEDVAKSAPTARYTLPQDDTATVAQLPGSDKAEQKVLGVETVEKPFEIQEEKAQFSFFDKAESTLTEKNYTLVLLKNKKETGKRSLFKLVNNSSETREYTLEVVKGKTDSKNNKYLTTDFQEYLIGSPTFPKTVTLDAHQEMWFGIKSTDLKSTTDLTVKVGLVE